MERVLGQEERLPSLQHALVVLIQRLLRKGGESALGVYNSGHDYIHGRSKRTKVRRLAEDFVVHQMQLPVCLGWRGFFFLAECLGLE